MLKWWISIFVTMSLLMAPPLIWANDAGDEVSNGSKLQEVRARISELERRIARATRENKAQDDKLRRLERRINDLKRQ